MRSAKEDRDQGKWVESIVQDFVDTWPDNTLKNSENEKAWAAPLVGFSRGDDPHGR
jgi:hypothetical protein